MKRTVRVVAGYFERDGRVLVQQRLAHKSRGSLWEFPGGKVESGESDTVALARECVEELGVSVQVDTLLWQVAHEYDDVVIELFLYRASILDDAMPEAKAAMALQWVERQHLAKLPFCEADVGLVERLARGELA